MRQCKFYFSCEEPINVVVTIPSGVHAVISLMADTPNNGFAPPQNGLGFTR